MADKLILNANMIRKAERFLPKKCTVEKVIEVSEADFRRLYEKPMSPNYYLSTYKDLMGFYDESYHCVLLINEKNGDGLLVNSEGADYARYSQYIPNARGIVQQHEQTKEVGYLIARMGNCIDDWFELKANEGKFEIPLSDLLDEIDPNEIVVDYAFERLSDDPRISDCELTHNSFEVTKRELVETRLYCPLKFSIEPDDGSDCVEVDSANYIDYDYEINAKIIDDLYDDERMRSRGLIAYTDNAELNRKVFSAKPRVETRGGNIYGVITVKSYGKLDKTELIDLKNELTGQLSDGWGEGLEQRPITLDGDEALISFWNSDDFFLKPESAVFPDMEINQGMEGLS